MTGLPSFRLFKKPTEAETIALARKSLSSVAPEDDGFTGFDQVRMMKICLDAKRLMGFQAFLEIVNDLKVRQRNLIAGSATKDNLEFGRGVLSGIDLVAERFRVLAEKADGKGKEQFDKFSPI